MDLAQSPADRAFRADLRAWLTEHAPPPMPREVGPDLRARDLAWQRSLHEAGYAGINWPVEFGGRGLSLARQMIWFEETARAGISHVNSLFVGVSHAGPTIITCGTEAQKARWLPPILRGEAIWCQGFSEPEAGSDLASLQTRAVRDGDDLVVNGVKIWTSFAQVADHQEMLVRTDPDAPKHRGITCLVVDMHTPGIEIRPLITITGAHDFNEVFFDGVRVPADAILGPEHEGWRVAMTTLNHERGGVARLHLGTRQKVADLFAAAREAPGRAGGRAADDPALRQLLARVYLEAELLKLVSERAISGELHGRALGPEASIAKLVWSETDQHIGEVAAAVLGPDAGTGRWGRDRVGNRQATIAGGTTQINKNIIAQRVLGLPRG